jgi:hypothetical protein
MTPFQSLQMELQLMLNEPVSHAARPRRVTRLNPTFERLVRGPVRKPQAIARIEKDAQLAYAYRGGRG